MDKSKNELIERRRKRMRRKRIFFFTIFLITILITLCLKLPYFNVKTVFVSNNRTISSEELLNEAGVIKGTNIFYLNTWKIRDNIMKNPYVLSVDIKRKLPDSIELSVNERAAAFYSQKSNKFIIIDKNGVVLEERNSINNMKLVRLEGFDTSKTKVGTMIPYDDSRKLVYISQITDLILNNSSCKNITKVDITDALNLMVYYNNMCIKLGNGEDLSVKLNKAINIINDKNLASSKGYVDVGFNGNPVFFIEK